MSIEGITEFRCFSCGRRFHWKPEIAGKTLRCTCGEKVRCPEPHDQTMTAGESLDDTVGDVELDEHFDQIEDALEEEERFEESVQEASYRRIPQKGVFGKPVGFEVLFFAVLTLAGLSMAIVAGFMHKWWEWSIASAVLVGPYSAYRLWRVWPLWTQGRPWIQCLNQLMGVEDDEGDGDGADKV